MLPTLQSRPVWDLAFLSSIPAYDGDLFLHWAREAEWDQGSEGGLGPLLFVAVGDQSRALDMLGRRAAIELQLSLKFGPG